LVAVVAETYLQAVSTRKVEALVQTLGIAGISKSEISRLAASLDEQVEAFRTRRLDASYPSLWVDARYEHVRDGGRVVSVAVIVAYGVRADRVREVLGMDVGLSEDVALWRAFLQGLVGRGVVCGRLLENSGRQWARLQCVGPQVSDGRQRGGGMMHEDQDDGCGEALGRLEGADLPRFLAEDSVEAFEGAGGP
jgi:hypothetical protein